MLIYYLDVHYIHNENLDSSKVNKKKYIYIYNVGLNLNTQTAHQSIPLFEFVTTEIMRSLILS